ncbi:iron complex outermembrane receptor protein [Novosphingobium sp. 1529]|uniref:TonB-dependent receptor n=1 Tax=Novosphingobium sp. 1529 TaxID=3156424 RepID=UPI003398D6C2
MPIQNATHRGARPHALRTASALALCLAGAALPVLAHAAAAEPAPEPAPAPVADPTLTSTLDQIVVTAQKRKTDLQKTPIAISVLNAQALADRHIQSLVDLQSGGVPSLRVAPFYSRNSALIMNIRGIGVLSDSNQPARDQGVGVYVDGVYLGRAQGLGTALYDIENIEVLKGPQGTLFGRNTEGGAINIVTKKPSGEFHANALVGAGNYGSYKGELHVDLPKWGNLAAKIDGVVSHRDGLVKNPLAGQTDFNFYTKRGLRGEVLWTPTPDFSADYAYDTSYDASSPLYAQTVSAGTLKRPVAYPLEPNRVGVAAVGVTQQPSVGKTHGHRLLLEWHLDPHLQVKSIASYRELTQSQYDNGSATTSAISATGNFTGAKFSRYSLAQFRQNQASEELQLLGDYDRVKFVAGAMWYQEKVQDNAQAFYTMAFSDAAGSATTVIPYVTYDGITIDRASHVTTTSVGVFGQGTYTPDLAGDIFHLTLGARWTHDKKEGSLFTVNGATPSVNGVTAPRLLDASWSRVDPMINLAIDASEDVHLYGKWSTGYKSGGANSRSLTYAPFNPETVSMFELGAKTEFWDKRARFNVAAYTGTYKNIQLDFSANYLQYDAQGNLLNTTRTTTETHNAPGTGRLKGIEADFTVKPIPQLTLGASYAYTSVKIPNTSNPFPQANGVIITTPIPIYQVYTPKHAASGTVDVTLPVAAAELRLHLDANYDSGFYANYVDPGFNTATGAVTLAQPKGDASVTFNGRIGLADIALGANGAKMQVSVWGRNIFNEQHMFYKAASALVGTYGFFNEARTWGVEAQVRF